MCVSCRRVERRTFNGDEPQKSVFGASGYGPGTTSSRASGEPQTPIFNVKASVVELIEAAVAKTTNSALRTRLDQAGFEIYDRDPPDAFESEPLPSGLIL